MSARRRPPNRRACVTFDLESQGLRYTATVSYSAAGELNEIFLTNHKAGSQAGINASDSAIVCSLALQYGVPADVIRRALARDELGRGSSPLAVVLDRLARASS